MDQPSPVLSWVLAAVAVVIIGIAKSGFGSGVGIVAVPIFVFAFGDSAEAMGALLPLLIAADILSVYHHWGTWDKANLKVLAGGSVLGVVIGAGLMWWLMGMPRLWWMPDDWAGGQVAARRETAEAGLQTAIGVICLLYVLGDRVKARFAPEFRFQANYPTGTATGLIAGIVTTIAHAAGPVITIFLLGQHLLKQSFIGTAVIYFFAVNVLKQLTAYPLLGLTRTDTLWTGLWLLPLVPIGTFLGTRLNRVLSERAFRTVILLIVAVSGVQLIIGKDALFRALGLQ
jgi:uncharacterized membrane protein YfcA